MKTARSPVLSNTSTTSAMTIVIMQKSKIFLPVIFLFALLAGCSGKDIYSKHILLMDTFVTIDIKGDHPLKKKREAAEAAIARMTTLAQRFDYFSPDSEITRINQMDAGETLAVSADMFRILYISRYLYDFTDGAFDITVASSMEVWRTAEKTGLYPDEAALKRIKSTTGIENWQLDILHRTVSFKKEGVKLDLGGIAKGFVVDEGIKELKKYGVTDALINAGGDLYCMGSSPENTWTIGIRDPGNRAKTIAVRFLSEKGVATSGGYERVISIGRQSLSRIIDVDTGLPVNDIEKSVTVIAPNCVTADALATAFYSLTPQKALDTTQTLKDVECVIMDEGGEFYVSDGMKVDNNFKNTRNSL